MKTYTANALAALASDRIKKRRMILITVGTTQYGFWDGSEDFTPAAGINVDSAAAGKLFQPGGSLISVERGSTNINGTAPELTLRLRSTPNAELTPDILATILTEDYHRKRAWLFRAIFTEDDELIEVALRDRGFMDNVSLVEDPEAGTAMIEAKVESKLIDFSRGGAHDRNDESQRSTFSGDKGLGNIERASQLKRWGKGVTK
jgi:hypothetical protein